MSKNGKQNKNKKNRSRGRRRRGQWRAVSAFAPLTWRTLRYTDNKALTENAAGAGAANVYSLNGMYDPDFTGVGAQPMWFDQLLTVSGPYLKYRVTQVGVNVTFASMVNGNVYCYVNATSSNSIPASLIAAQQKPFAKSAILMPATSGKGQHVFRFTVDLANVLGVTRAHLLNDDYYAGSYTANPLQGCYLQIGIFAAPGGAVVGMANYAITLDYRAQVYQLSPNATTS